jgi:hypothetical protein
VSHPHGSKPLHAMRSDEFLRRAIAILVNPTMVGGTKRLTAVDESRSACDRFELELISSAPRHERDTGSWAKGRIDALFSVCFADDVWHSSTPSGTPLVLIKQTAIDGRMDLDEALRRIHVKEITRALTEGVSVPSAVLDDYRILLESMTATREVN